MSKLLIGGSWVDGESSQPLHDKYAGAVYGEMAVASAAQVEAAVSGAVAGQQASKLAPYELYKILSKAAVILESRIELLVELMRVEAGFTRADGENEVRRCVQTLEGHTDEIFSCAFNYEGDYIITGSKDNTCRIWRS